jgi:hypothetical protein
MLATDASPAVISRLASRLPVSGQFSHPEFSTVTAMGLLQLAEAGCQVQSIIKMKSLCVAVYCADFSSLTPKWVQKEFSPVITPTTHRLPSADATRKGPCPSHSTKPCQGVSRIRTGPAYPMPGDALQTSWQLQYITLPGPI